ncbi:MAG: ATP-binding protein, partial [Alphaproteobacteria bacterium]
MPADDGGWRALVVLPRAMPQAMAAELERRIATALSHEGFAGPVQVVLVADPTMAGAAASPAAGTSPSASPPPAGHRPMAGVGERGDSGLRDVRHIVAVASGKGGVGKSTVAVNLAVALARQGLAVGLMDADIYGPSAPVLLGLRGKPEVSPARRLVPLEAHGIKAMSMGFLIDPDKAAIWRGPMVAGAVSQLLHDVEWGALDVLVVDMPPGTGDAQLTLVQRARPSGAVIVSTPQDLALADARRAVQMFRRVEVPILGIVENMSVFICPHCGGESAIFGQGGAAQEAERLGVPFLG